MWFGAAFFFPFLPLIIFKHIQYNKHNSSNQKQNLEKLDHGASFNSREDNNYALKPGQTGYYAFNVSPADLYSAARAGGLPGRQP